MSVMNSILGSGSIINAIGNAVKSTSEVFRANETELARFNAQRSERAQTQFASEFALAPTSRFEQFVNGLNRLPRPLLAFGTIGLFAYAMTDPEGFGLRMRGLSEVPEPLWWLLGAIVGFYFGARELYYMRTPKTASIAKTEAASRPNVQMQSVLGQSSRSKTPDLSERIANMKTENPAILAWMKTQL